VEQGGVVGIIGRNGAGKSTLQLNIAVIDSMAQKTVYTPSLFFPSRRFMIVSPGTFLKSLTLSVKIPSSPRSRQCCAMSASFIRIFDA
jgi:ABC-type nitrate/sulfonate/bicarbonate transport system ATPase subunit